jgi:hypothetical protein
MVALARVAERLAPGEEEAEDSLQLSDPPKVSVPHLLFNRPLRRCDCDGVHSAATSGESDLRERGAHRAGRV